MRRMDIHNYKKKYERMLQRIREEEDLSKEDRKTILKFNDYCVSEGIPAIFQGRHNNGIL